MRLKRAKIPNNLFLLPMIAALISCKATFEDNHYSHEHHSSHGSHDSHYESPELLSMTLVDSFGTSSNEYHHDLFLNPYIDDGLFEVYWNVHSDDDFVVEYRVGKTPFASESRLINSELCGYGHSCDESSFQFCQYSPSLSLACDYTSASSYSYHLDIDDLIYELPDKLYFILQVCDVDYHTCEYESKEVYLQ